jgi:hypothetical protein
MVSPIVALAAQAHVRARYTYGLHGTKQALGSCMLACRLGPGIQLQAVFRYWIVIPGSKALPYSQSGGLSEIGEAADRRLI